MKTNRLCSIVSNELAKQGNSAKQFVGNISSNSTNAFMTTPVQEPPSIPQRRRIDANNSESSGSLSFDDFVFSATKSGNSTSTVSADTFIEAQPKLLEEAIKAKKKTEDPIDEELQRQILQDQAALTRANLEIAQLNFLK